MAAVEATARKPAGVFVGLATLDIIQRVDSLPERNRKATAFAQGVAGGGPALNAAIVFAALGGEATLVSRVGHGPIADIIRQDLAEHRVTLLDLAGPDFVPSVSSIVVDRDTGDRQIVSTDAGAIRARTDSAGPDVLAAVNAADVALFDGHHEDITVAAVRPAANRGIPRIVDAGRWKPVMSILIPASSDVICSADFRVDGATTGQDLMSTVLSLGPTLAAVTDGPRSVNWQTHLERGQVTPPTVTAVDTLGAGDFFHGAFAYARATAPDDSPARHLSFATRVAALKCRYTGTRSWLRHLGTDIESTNLRTAIP
jgi:sugar/nucleoside kinase (ribokinase family)